MVVLLVAVFVAGSVVTVVLVVMRSKTSPPQNDCGTKQFNIDNPNYSGMFFIILYNENFNFYYNYHR